MSIAYLKALKEKPYRDRTVQDWVVIYFFEYFATIGGLILGAIAFFNFLVFLVLGNTSAVGLSVVFFSLFILLALVGFAVSQYLGETWW